jgi:hypothetical protein
MNNQPEDKDLLDQIRERLGIKDDHPIVAGDATKMGKGGRVKTEEELYIEEMEFLHHGGSDPFGFEKWGEVMRGLGRR